MNGIEFALPGVNLFNLYQYMVIFFVSSLRISSFLISAPFFSLGGIPLQVRIIASISLTGFLFPVIKVPEIQNIQGFNFYERTLLSPVFSIDEARKEFTKERFFRYLNTRNVRGFRREKTDWFPGSGKDIPQLHNLVYNNKSQIKHFDIDKILNNVLDGYQINDDELNLLFNTAGEKINDIADVANQLNFLKNGNKVTFVKNRNINYTNQCYYKCGFLITQVNFI